MQSDWLTPALQAARHDVGLRALGALGRQKVLSSSLVDNELARVLVAFSVRYEKWRADYQDEEEKTLGIPLGEAVQDVVLRLIAEWLDHVQARGFPQTVGDVARLARDMDHQLALYRFPQASTENPD